jgi:hypothetical protein
VLHIADVSGGNQHAGNAVVVRGDQLLLDASGAREQALHSFRRLGFRILDFWFWVLGFGC